MPAKLAAGLIVSIIITSSCSDPSNIGLQLDPNNNQIGVFYAEIPLSASMVLLDSFNTTNTEVLVVGGGTSEFFGKTEAIGFSRLAINLDSPLPDEDAILDSVKFNFQVQSVIGKDLGTPKSLNVHLLDDPIKDIPYFNFNKIPFKPETIANGNFNFSAQQDTIVSVHMAETFGQMIFQEMKNGNRFGDIFAFRDFIPGIAITGDIQQEASFSLRRGNGTGLLVFYHNEGDTVSQVYPMTTAQSRHFNYVNNNRSGTPIAPINTPGTAFDINHPTVGSKSILGVVLKIDTAPIISFLDTLTNVTFNEVIFEIGPLESTQAQNLPPNFIRMYFTNDQNTFLYRSDGDPLAVQANDQPQLARDSNGNIVPNTSAPAILAYNPESKIYLQRITSYLNALYRSDLQQNDWLLYPGQKNNLSGEQNLDDNFKKSLRELIVNKNNIKLKIYYSKIRAF